MVLTVIYTAVMAILWMIFARQFTIEGFVVGAVFGFAIVQVVRINTVSFNEEGEELSLFKIPSQLIALVIYMLRLTIDVILSGLDVGSKVIQAKMPINPGTTYISTQDKSNNSIVSALSAHSITITPGELVIDYGEEDGQTMMLVHTLDKEASNREKLETDQTNRLKLIRQILGKDTNAKGTSNGMD